MTEQKKRAGLAEVIAGSTAICTVGKGMGLSYRGYAIEDLAEHSNFEETAYLLLYGELPDEHQLADYRALLRARRDLPPALKAILESIPASAHPMDVMRTACSALGCMEPEGDFSQQHDVANRLLAAFPSMLLYWYHFRHHGKRIDLNSDAASVAGHFLRLLHQKPVDAFHCRVLDISLILYAEHEFNASTFAARVTASTLADFYSAVTGAVGALRGPLHGGANEAAMALIARFGDPAEVPAALRAALARKEKIMGFGHRVYKTADPRNPIIKRYAKQLAERCGDSRYFAVSEAIEKIMWDEKKLFPNLDFYSASAYFFMGIPVPLYTPIFICSRISGWAAHIFEQRANNALIRPSADYHGPAVRAYVPISHRGPQTGGNAKP